MLTLDECPHCPWMKDLFDNHFEELQKYVIECLENTPPGWGIMLPDLQLLEEYGKSSFLRDEMIEAVKKGDKLGKIIMKIYGLSIIVREKGKGKYDFKFGLDVDRIEKEVQNGLSKKV